MAIASVSRRSKALGIAAVVFGLLGFAFYWWVPLGMVLSLTGLMLAVIGWISGPHFASNAGWVFAGLLISAAALALDLFIAVQGLEIIHLMSYR
ncbi:MAG TPA: hypothetical protein VGY58_22430 [Gemmataceae bacterium]|nr:hypothetical protein [Gemmataceae bacterium]